MQKESKCECPSCQGKETLAEAWAEIERRFRSDAVTDPLTENMLEVARLMFYSGAAHAYKMIGGPMRRAGGDDWALLFNPSMAFRLEDELRVEGYAQLVSRSSQFGVGNLHKV